MSALPSLPLSFALLEGIVPLDGAAILALAGVMGAAMVGACRKRASSEEPPPLPGGEDIVSISGLMPSRGLGQEGGETPGLPSEAEEGGHLTHVCAYCGNRVGEDGRRGASAEGLPPQRISHGICLECARIHFASAAGRLRNTQPRA